jgi:hypothetical protein
MTPKTHRPLHPLRILAFTMRLAQRAGLTGYMVSSAWQLSVALIYAIPHYDAAMAIMTQIVEQVPLCSSVIQL